MKITSMNTIELTKEEYLRLKEDSIKLEMLECGGVDNWEGLSESLYPDNDMVPSFDERIEKIIESLGL